MSRNEEYSRLRLQTLPLPPLDPFLSSEHFVARVTIKLFFAQVWRWHGAKSPDPPLDFPTWLQPAPSASGIGADPYSAGRRTRLARGHAHHVLGRCGTHVYLDAATSSTTARSLKSSGSGMLFLHRLR